MTTPPATPTPPTPPKSKKFLWIVLIIVGVLLLSCCICGGVFYYLMHRGVQAVSHSMESGAFVETVSGGSVSITKLPKDFPSDIPIYPGAKLGVSFSGGQKGKEGGSIMMTTSDKPATVTDFYSNKMVAEGWKNTMTQNMPEETSLIFSKADRQVFVIVGKKTDGENTVSILYGKDQKTEPKEEN